MKKLTRLASLSVLALGLAASGAFAQSTVNDIFVKREPPPAPDRAEISLQDRYRAILAMQEALGEAGKDIDANNQMLNLYLKEQKMEEGYQNNFTKLRAKVQEQIPLTFNEALGITLADVQKNPSSYADFILPSKLDENQYSAQRAMVLDKWNQLMPELQRVGAKAYYIESQGKWDLFLGWLDVEVEKQEREYKEMMAKRKKDVAEKAQKEYDESKKRMYELQEKRKKEQAEELQRQWDRRMTEYQLDTQRIIANRSRFYSNGYWRDDRWRRNVVGFY